MILYLVNTASLSEGAIFTALTFVQIQLLPHKMLLELNTCMQYVLLILNEIGGPKIEKHHELQSECFS